MNLISTSVIRTKTGIDEAHSFGIGHILVLLTLAATVIWVIWGVMTQGYYMPEIATPTILYYGNRFRCDRSHL